MLLHNNLNSENPFKISLLERKTKSLYSQLETFADLEVGGFYYQKFSDSSFNTNKHLEENTVMLWLMSEYLQGFSTQNLKNIHFYEQTIAQIYSLWSENLGVEFDEKWLTLATGDNTAKLDDLIMALLKTHQKTSNKTYLDQACQILRFIESDRKNTESEIIYTTSKKNSVSWATSKHIFVLLEIYEMCQTNSNYYQQFYFLVSESKLEGNTDFLKKLQEKLFDYFMELNILLGKKNYGYDRGYVIIENKRELKNDYKVYGNCIIGLCLIRYQKLVKISRDKERNITTFLNNVLNLLQKLWDPSYGGFYRSLSSTPKKEFDEIEKGDKNVIANILASIFLTEYISYSLPKTKTSKVDKNLAFLLHQLDVTTKNIFESDLKGEESISENWKVVKSDHKKLHPLYLTIALSFRYKKMLELYPEEIRTYRSKLGEIMKTKIFLSHKSSDKDFVRGFSDTLKQLGFNPWIDEDQGSGNLIRTLKTGMKESCAAVFFITPEFQDEKYINSEINYALAEEVNRQGKFEIITLVFEKNGQKGVVPSSLTDFIYKEPKSELEALREIIKCLPITLEKGLTWKE